MDLHHRRKDGVAGFSRREDIHEDRKFAFPSAKNDPTTAMD
jgi:hypothetical protein